MRFLPVFFSLQLVIFNFFIQKNNSDPIKEKLIKLLEIVYKEEDIHAVEIFKKDYPGVFKYFPDINPINPTNDYKISSKFSSKRLHPIYGKVKAHNGIDIVAKINTPVYATADGVIKVSKFFNGAAGHSVTINHKYGFVTKYFHLSLFVVEPGEKVIKGQIIGFLGDSGSSTAPHLHYELWKNSKVLNPKSFIK